ncbi:MAG: TetR/AcrR family transcriptional regulator [Planctomycetota bacterium]
MASAAMESFWQNGYADTSLRDIGDQCGVGLQSIYNEFGDKSGLYVSALNRYCDAVLDSWRQYLESEPRALAGLDALIDFWADFFSTGGGRGCLLTMSLVDFGRQADQIGSAARLELARLEDLLRERVKLAQEEGDLGPGRDPDQLASAMLTSVNGLCALSRASCDPHTIREGALAVKHMLR